MGPAAAVSTTPLPDCVLLEWLLCGESETQRLVFLLGSAGLGPAEGTGSRGKAGSEFIQCFCVVLTCRLISLPP